MLSLLLLAKINLILLLDGGEIDENEAHYLCPICGKTKETRIKFRDHVRAHKTKVRFNNFGGDATLKLTLS